MVLVWYPFSAQQPTKYASSWWSPISDEELVFEEEDPNTWHISVQFEPKNPYETLNFALENAKLRNKKIEKGFLQPDE